MKYIVWLFVLFGAIYVFAGENLVKNGDAAGGSCPLPEVEIVENGPNGVKCFAAKGAGKRL